MGPGNVPTAAQFGRLRAFLAKPNIGMSQAEITAAIGLVPAGRTRGEIAEQLEEWIRNR
jgi:hypothetical protein